MKRYFYAILLAVLIFIDTPVFAQGKKSIELKSYMPTPAATMKRAKFVNTDGHGLGGACDGQEGSLTVAASGELIFCIKEGANSKWQKSGGYWQKNEPAVGRADYFLPETGGVLLNVGIGTSTPAAKLSVITTAGSAAVIGDAGNQATGLYALALGESNQATGPSSIAVGSWNTASGHHSFAAGRANEAVGDNAVALGHGAKANGGSSLAFGLGAQAGSDFSVALGHNAKVCFDDAGNLICNLSLDEGKYSVAIGPGTKSSGKYGAIAIGAGSQATGEASVAIGKSAATHAYDSKAIGYGAIVANSATHSFAISLSQPGPYTVTQPNVMVIMGGNVGIGVTAPLDRLEVSSVGGKNIRIGGVPGNYMTSAYFTDLGKIGAVISMQRSLDTAYHMGMFTYSRNADGSGAQNLGFTSRNDIVFVAGENERVRFAGTGLVGIGISAPQAQLHAHGVGNNIGRVAITGAGVVAGPSYSELVLGSTDASSNLRSAWAVYQVKNANALIDHGLALGYKNNGGTQNVWMFIANAGQAAIGRDFYTPKQAVGQDIQDVALHLKNPTGGPGTSLVLDEGRAEFYGFRYNGATHVGGGLRFNCFFSSTHSRDSYRDGARAAGTLTFSDSDAVKGPAWWFGLSNNHPAANGAQVTFDHPLRVYRNRIEMYAPVYLNGYGFVPDYVFADDYALETIEEHADFMFSNKHLPAVTYNQKKVDEGEGMDVAQHTNQILEELEKAHIYIWQLNNRVRELEQVVKELTDRAR